ncbi:hypothetical protein F6V30_14020 [Oryzomonas sagensis]|uniref:Portal protein n=1 Tax=Oryzomonas sagensis TaxID=2603857 RepID=A0ABQ6TL03_9BACT|nr:hypothetical protein [Oryzomonas sagensis]KAB0668950.1 hypothetical protein F6V30_14020 [Oryzomonas sagensis]
MEKGSASGKFEDIDDDDLSRPLQLKRSFDNWYDFHLKSIIDDCRNRYMMILDDAQDRISRGLSALPSTKSTSIVDGFVENAILEYNQDPDAISFTSRTATDPVKDKRAQILTEDFIYRKDNTSNYHLWEESSLRAGATDGLEAAFVHWVKEAYEKPLPDRRVLKATGEEVPEAIYGALKDIYEFETVKNSQTITVRDTWVIDKLMPRRDCFWDPKIPYLDVNLGTYAGIMIPVTAEEIEKFKEIGVFDADFDMGEALGMLSSTRDGNDAAMQLSNYDFSDAERVDLQEKNRAELMIFFEKRDFQWFVQFSLQGTFELSTFQPVNDVFFNGRPVNRLPMVVGYCKSRLWDATGVGFPEVIAPIEDELSDHRNNANDIAKQIAQGGRIRLSPDHNVNLDDVLNARAFEAEKDEVEFIQYPTGLLESMRMDDARTQDIASLVPMGIADRSRQLAMKGSTKGLGLHQMAEQDNNAKLGVNLMIRNNTFFKPVLALIAHLTMAFESDEVVLKIAARNAGTQFPTTFHNGRQIIDLTMFDFEFDVQINAGLGATPRYKKAQNILEIAKFRKEWNIPTDWGQIASQLNVLAGFNADQFNAQPPPPQPPEVDYKANINIDLAQLPPQAQMVLLQKMMAGGMSITAKVDGKNPQMQKAINESKQNGGIGLPERSGMAAPDMRGEMGAAMSAGGQQNAGIA